VPLVLKSNYLGSVTADRFKLEGPITVRSFLDGPWPDGREVEIDPEEHKKKAAHEKKAGLAAFNDRQYGQAYEHLKSALAYEEERETRLYLAYVLNALGEEEELEELLTVAVDTYPYEVRFFNLAIRRALAAGENEQAKTLLDRAMKLNPGNQMLEGLKMMVDAQ